MAQSLAPLAPRGGMPATLEQVSAFRVKAAALSRPAAPVKGDANLVIVTDADGELVVHMPGHKLATLSGWRQGWRTR